MKYNKKRNTAFLYEALVFEMTKAIINKDEKRKAIALDILKENFSADSILHEELDAYKAVLETKGVNKEWACLLYTNPSPRARPSGRMPGGG